MTIVIVTTAIIVLIGIFAVFLVVDNDSKKQNRDEDISLTQPQDNGKKGDNNSDTKHPNVTINVPEIKDSSVVKKNDRASNDDGKDSKKGSSSKRNSKIKETDKKKNKSKSNKGLPIDWFDE